MFASILFSCVAVFAFTLTTMAQDEVVAEDTTAVVEDGAVDDGMVVDDGVVVGDCGCNSGFVSGGFSEGFVTDGESVVMDGGDCFMSGDDAFGACSFDNSASFCAPQMAAPCAGGFVGKRGGCFSHIFRPRYGFGHSFFNHCRPVRFGFGACCN